MTTLPYTLPAPLPGTVTAPGAPPRRDGSLTPAPDVRADIAARVLAEYRESPRLIAWIASEVERIGEVDACAVALYEQAFDIDRASGVMLDRLADLVGEPVRGAGDFAMRRLIRVRALVNRAHGTAPELAAIARAAEAIDDPAASVRVTSDAPREVTVFVDATAIATPLEVRAPLLESVEAGKRLLTATVPAPYARAQLLRLDGVSPGLSNALVGVTGGVMGCVLG